MTLSHISDTAKWVAAYRAIESERADAAVRDPLARVLAGEEGERLIREIPFARFGGWILVTRTRAIDELVEETLNRDPAIRRVINLAAGLDTRPYRLRLKPDLVWTEVDLPELLAYKEAKLGNCRPVCRLERESVNLLDPHAFSEFLGKHADSPTLVLTEGFLMYVDERAAHAIAGALSSNPFVVSWIHDTLSPEVIRWLNLRWKRHFRRAGAEFRFGPMAGSFARDGWRVAESRSTVSEAVRIHRAPLYARPAEFLWRSARERIGSWSGVARLARA